jgi:hypothetical protein
MRLCDYAGAGRLVPDTVLDLHTAASGPESPGRTRRGRQIMDSQRAHRPVQDPRS